MGPKYLDCRKRLLEYLESSPLKAMRTFKGNRCVEAQLQTPSERSFHHLMAGTELFHLHLLFIAHVFTIWKDGIRRQCHAWTMVI